MKRIWDRAPWWPGQTIWLAPHLEADFVEDCRRAGLDLEETAPVLTNTLRWRWRLSILDRRDDEGWRKAITAALKRQARIDPPLEGYIYQSPPATPPDDLRIKQVHRRATGYELAAQTGPVDRSTKAKQRRQRSRERQAPAKFDASAFLAQHWPTVFGSLFKSLHLDPNEVDSPIGHRLALAWHAVITEQVRLGYDTYGPARKAWHALLRELRL